MRRRLGELLDALDAAVRSLPEALAGRAELARLRRELRASGAPSIRELSSAYWDAERRLALLRFRLGELHVPIGPDDPWCQECWLAFPCPTRRLADEAGKGSDFIPDFIPGPGR